MEIVLRDKSRKIVLIDGDESQVNGFYWRVRSEILQWIGMPFAVNAAPQKV